MGVQYSGKEVGGKCERGILAMGITSGDAYLALELYFLLILYTSQFNRPGVVQSNSTYTVRRIPLRQPRLPSVELWLAMRVRICCSDLTGDFGSR